MLLVICKLGHYRKCAAAAAGNTDANFDTLEKQVDKHSRALCTSTTITDTATMRRTTLQFALQTVCLTETPKKRGSWKKEVLGRNFRVLEFQSK